jgi:hypothetical protein
VSGVLIHSAADRYTARRLAVEAAGLCVAHRGAIHYTQGWRRWDGIRLHKRAIRGDYPNYADCSAFVSWCLWTATRKWHLGDFANGDGWAGGFTGTLINHGSRVSTRGPFLLADVALYGWQSRGVPEHTTLIVHDRGGVPHVVSHGSEAGPLLLPLRYRGDLVAVRRMIR